MKKNLPKTFKASYLDSKSAPRLQKKIKNQQVVQSEYLAQLGGLRLLGLCKSSSPRRKEIKEKLLPSAMKSLKSTPDSFRDSEKSFKVLKSVIDSQSNFLFNFELGKSEVPKKIIIVGNNDFGREFTLKGSKSFSNISRVTLDSSAIPQGRDEEKWEKMINYAEFKSRLKSPFR